MSGVFPRYGRWRENRRGNQPVPSDFRLHQNSVNPAFGNDHVLVVLHSVVTDNGVVDAAEHLVAGDAVIRLLRMVPRCSAFYQVLPPAPLRPAEPAPALPLRIVATGDDMATTLLDLSRELKITLLAMGEPPRGGRRPRFIRKVLSRLLIAGSTPVLYVPPSTRGPRQDLRRILLVLHAPYPAFDLLETAVPLARRSHADVMILTLPSAEPVIPDPPSAGPSSLAFAPFDATAWLERECARRGCKARPVPKRPGGADTIVERAAELEADLVIAGASLAEVRFGWRRRRMLDAVFPRLSCPLLFGRCA